MIGTTVGHYKIESKLGEGGMGVVYKATDTKLDRTVALKFLPPHVSISEETKARFIQEAKAAAALNHANICTVHGVEEDEDKIFIVMEFVDGGTLRSKIPYQNIDEGVNVASQIAEALSEAHAKGIVHRDIKADNIMLTGKGQAKVMDFGLAKLKGSLKLTRTSSTVGTLAYMAPEQIQGGEVDTRSDIFSFGSLLFEMLTGKTPFRGEHEAAMVYSIVNEEPQAIEQLRPDTPPLLVGLVQKCLEKDPADRYQHMEDIVSELRRSQKKTSRVMRTSSYMPAQPHTAAPATGPATTTSIPSQAPKSPAVRYGLYGSIVLVLAVIGWFVMVPSGISVNPDMVTRVLQVPFTQYSYPSLSPDGKWIAFPAADATGKWDIYYMHVNGGEPRKITNDATGFIQQSAHISPDGSEISYDKPNDSRTTHDIYAVSSLGGTSRLLAPRGIAPKWRPDGKRVGFQRQPGDNRIDAESGFIELWSVGGDGKDLRLEYKDTLFVTRGGNYRYSFCWSPDGRSIAWIRSYSSTSQVLVTVNLETGEERILTAGEENIDDMGWTVDDRIIFSSNRGGNTNLWSIPATGGEAVQVTKGGGPDIGIAVDASGQNVVYLQQQKVGFLWTQGIDGGAARQLTFDEREIIEPALSPDMSRIAFVMNDPDPLTPRNDLYVINANGTDRRRLTNGNSNTRRPVWSPDGKYVAYTMVPTQAGSDTGRPRNYVVSAENPGAPKLVGYYFSVLWMDNDHILSTNGLHTYINTVSSGEFRRFFLDSTTVWIVKDGKTIVYYDRRQASRGWWSVETQPLVAAELLKQTGDVVMPGLRGKPRKMSDAPSYLSRYTSWATSDGMVAQFDGPEKLRLVSLLDGRERVLKDTFTGLTNASIDLSDDGKTVIYVTPRLSSRLVLLENVFN